MSNLTDFTTTASPGPYQEVIHNSAYTFAIGDEEHRLHKSTDAAAYSWTIPLNATVNFATGSVFTIFNAGVGDLTIIADGAATLIDVNSATDGNRTIAQNSIVTIVQTVTDGWVLIDHKAGANAYSTWLVKTTTFTASNGDQLICNHATTPFTITLPAGSVGDTVILSNTGAALVTIGRNGAEKINSVAADGTLPTGNSTQLVYVDATVGWFEV